MRLLNSPLNTDKHFTNASSTDTGHSLIALAVHDQMLRFVLSTYVSTEEAMISQCSGGRCTPLPPKRRSSLMVPRHIVRMSITSWDLALSKRGHSSKKCRTVSRSPHSHSSSTLTSSLDLEKFKLHVPKRRRARIVCCHLRSIEFRISFWFHYLH